MNTFKQVIDKAADLCGSQTELARRLSVSKAALSMARHGKQPLAADKLAALAALIDADPAALWELQELANMPRRNPFLRVAEAVAAAFVCVVLSVAPNDANAVAIGPNAHSVGGAMLHIVANQPGRQRGFRSMKISFYGIDHAPKHCGREP